MALRLTKLADEAIQWLREKYETLRNQLTIGRSRMSKDPYRIISEGTREKEIQLGHMSVSYTHLTLPTICSV